MTTSRGFVQRIAIGRGGLVTVTLVLDDGTTGVFVITDIDADPERFNERLSKLAVLRDAMNRAEPVEVEHDKGKAGEEIERATRITRDALDPVSSIEQVIGLVLDLLVHAENGIGPGGLERHDYADIRLLTLAGGLETVRLDLQAPERVAAAEMLELLRGAAATGGAARVLVSSGGDEGPPVIIEVAIVDQAGAFGRGSGATVVSGFVESLGLIPLFGGGGGATANLAWARFTTAPEFSGTGNSVDPAAFTPDTITLLVPESSPTYELVEAGLRDNVRMRVATMPLAHRQPPTDDSPELKSRSSKRTQSKAESEDALSTLTASTDTPVLTLAAELLAPLASASRPVWIMIDRDMIDSGPDADCTPGVPINDLTPQGLRDLRIPYTARWHGLGCFNHGVYRIELAVAGDLKIELDGKELCVYDSTTPGTRLAYACIDGDHWLTVEISNWTCDNDFVMDVYRIR